MNYGIHFDVGGEMHIHFTNDVAYDRIRIEDINVLVLRYKRRGEMVDTIMPLARVIYITEG